MTELLDDVVLLGARRPAPGLDPCVVVRAEGAELDAYRALRRDVFVREQGLFAGTDADDVDDDPRTIVLVARATDGEVLGGVRLHPALPGRDIGWWRGSRLVVAPDARGLEARSARTSTTVGGVGAALVRAACATAEAAGALRFDATVQAQNERLFRRLGWVPRERVHLHGHPHVVVDWPVARVQRLADSTKAALGDLVGTLVDSGAGFLGDDGAPVPGSDLVAACDAILPAMVERDPEWAGWCAALVNLNDLSAMGAAPVGMLDAIGARDASFARRIVRGLGEASRAWGVPVLGGHTQLGVPAALSVTALGRTSAPVPGGGGRVGQAVRLTADLGGSWRPGYTGAQWDSSSHRTSAELRSLAGVVPGLAPAAAKDVSMSGLVGTTGMLAEASGCRAVLDVADVPAPDAASYGDWLTCFPGFAMVTTERAPAEADLPGFLTSQVCGELTHGTGVGLRWPDGVVTEAITSPVTGLGAA
ncbi:MSMEG_0567/sll0787 family protein [Nocardioides lianchengensis]|uniref:Putative N-acetyltransferase, MSMEG_0567 N-terminal domain family n=1 Tax=Nocardioides lianchengensis TaxID=1045774 RepID=A0A1G6RBH9_9ACTN|nr:MSMEG_0567/sll0787 family protein [Nocardioides lianchengensis]NYG10292.1 putative N-acetyltransferase (TIGR04045 family) [Nocardioides lianchengensis]SDD01980.1 putative N-acetyltransferase, MSMEG_0567 N-terminal domain family [Nocardioides lianchengensis]